MRGSDWERGSKGGWWEWVQWEEYKYLENKQSKKNTGKMENGKWKEHTLAIRTSLMVAGVFAGWSPIMLPKGDSEGLGGKRKAWSAVLCELVDG